MKNYIRNYDDEYYVFKLAPDQNKHIEYMQIGFNHIYKDNGIYKLYTYDGYINYENGVIQTTKKKDSKNHGIGIQNIIQVVKKNKGYYVIDPQKEEFYIRNPCFQKTIDSVSFSCYNDRNDNFLIHCLC